MWVLVRLGAAFVGMTDPTAAAELLIVGVVGVAVLLDARRRSEDLFLGNLGIRSTAIAFWAVPLALIAELLVP